MKKFFVLIFLSITTFAHSQLLIWNPDFIQETSTGAVITANANYGNEGLLNYTPTTDVYVHIGVITNYSTSTHDWKYVLFTWGTTPAAAQCTYIGNNEWQYSINTDLRSFFGITDANEHIQKIAILLRNGAGSVILRNADESDMFIPVYGDTLCARIDNPFRQPTYTPIPVPLTKNIGDNVPIVAKANLAGSTIQVYFNGILKSTVAGTKDSTNVTIANSGNQTIIEKATNGSSVSYDTLNFYVNNVAAIPAGNADGINYEPGDTSVTLVLYAPQKKNIIAVGDFNNWTPSYKYQMNVTPDGNYFWIRLTGLTKGMQYAYQYLIDNSLQLADYNAELVLDKSNDPAIPPANFPNLKSFPAGAAGTLAGVFQTAQTPYAWHDANFVKPDKKNLAIYELLVADFVSTQSWTTIADTLNYLKKLGINAIEVMPFCNYEGAFAWGYSPNFYFASEKLYGTSTALKQFVDACHAKGIAVIMDLTMDDVAGSSSLASMYWNSAANTPAANNPWLDENPTYPNSYFYEFNHDAPATIALRNRVYTYWIDSFHLDGFRFDEASGYTQTNFITGGNEYDYDQDRVNTWNNIYAKLESIKPNTYCILESFVNNEEELIYTNAGMMTWGNGGNENYNFNQATMGYSSGWDFSAGIYTVSGLTQPGEVTYQQSHDQDRLMYNNETFGNASGTYNTRDTITGLQRNAMATCFWAIMPGPKMMYEFDELGYDYSVNYCANGTLSDNCRINPKPVRWDYLQNVNRLALYNVYSKLLNLKNNPAYFATFTTGAVNENLSGSLKWMSVGSNSLQVMVFGNFDVVNITSTISFPSTGTWYNLFSGKDTTVTSTALTNVTLAPGQYAVYVNNSGALPLTWLNFTAHALANNTALLTWVTANEINTGYFEIERSYDGIHFETIGDVSAEKSSATNQYQFTDVHAQAGVNYYRLKEIDKNGTFSYSSIATVNISNAGLWKVYPNPAESNNTALYALATFNNFSMSLTDISGKILYRFSTNLLPEGSKINIPLTGLASGIYLLKITSDKFSGTDKIVVQ